jgi:hypothetical protein
VTISAEASEGRESTVSGRVAVRPTESIRLNGSATFSRITRASDGSESARTIVPRLTLEYQRTPALVFRAVAEYRSQRQLEDLTRQDDGFFVKLAYLFRR